MEANERLTVGFCWCGLEHAIPNNLHKMAVEDKHGVYCPLGHKWFIRKTECQKLRERVSALAFDLNEANAETRRLERKLRAPKKKPKKKKK